MFVKLVIEYCGLALFGSMDGPCRTDGKMRPASGLACGLSAENYHLR